MAAIEDGRVAAMKAMRVRGFPFDENIHTYIHTYMRYLLLQVKLRSAYADVDLHTNTKEVYLKMYKNVKLFNNNNP